LISWVESTLALNDYQYTDAHRDQDSCETGKVAGAFLFVQSSSVDEFGKRGKNMPHSVPVSKLMMPPSAWPLIRADADAGTAVKILRIVSEDKKLEHGHSTPLVMDDDYKPLGFVHLTDLMKVVRHLCEKADEPCDIGRATTPVRDLVTPFAGSVGPEDSILKALDIMMDHNVSLVPVMKDGKLQGLVKLADVFSTVAALLFNQVTPEERHSLLRDFHL
jgi:CBS domain-containing protein